MAVKRNSFTLLASNSQESVRFWAQHPPYFNYVFPFLPQLVSLWNVGHHGSIQVDSPPTSFFLFIMKKKKKRSLGWPGVLPGPWRHLMSQFFPISELHTACSSGHLCRGWQSHCHDELPPTRECPEDEGCQAYPISRVMMTG